MDGNIQLHIQRMKSILVVEVSRQFCHHGSSRSFNLSGHSVEFGMLIIHTLIKRKPFLPFFL